MFQGAKAGRTGIAIHVFSATSDPMAINPGANTFRTVEHVDQFQDFRTLLMAAPAHLQELAYHEMLQYLLEEVAGKILPVITTVFWTNESEDIVSPHGIAEMNEKGWRLLNAQTMEPTSAYGAWRDCYEMSDSEGELQRGWRNPPMPSRQHILLYYVVLIGLHADIDGVLRALEGALGLEVGELYQQAYPEAERRGPGCYVG